METYKYLNESDAQKFLQNWSIAFKHPAGFNDQFDFLPVYTGRTPEERTAEIETRAEKYFLERQPHVTRSQALGVTAWELDRFEKMHISDLRCYVRTSAFWVTCFSRTETNLLMWSHYAKTSGVVVEFDTNAPLLKDQLRPVLYSQKRPRIDVRGFSYKAKLPDPYFVKSLDWAYEQEERVVLSLGEAREFEKSKSASPNEHGGTNSSLLLLPVEPEYVRRLIFGAGFLRDRENKNLVSGLLRNPETAHIVLNSAKLDPSEYKIICEPLPPELVIELKGPTTG